MGRFDSSRTRVRPVFDRLYQRDQTGHSWLPQLLHLPRRFDGEAAEVPQDPGQLDKKAWYPHEEQLPAPKALLRTLIERPELLSFESADAVDKRELLRRRDAKTRQEALKLLDSYTSGRAWFVFEGPTSVDAYLETERLIVLIEGKRTEAGPTMGTRWMAVRHQLLRNLDAAREASDKAAVAFFIVEGVPPEPTVVPKGWEQFARDTISEDALSGSLPHRNKRERDEIARSFLGVTTWQAVCREFEISFEDLPDVVET